MKIVWFVHAIASCWNNGNAHFLRGLGLALQNMGHDITFFEPRENWSESNLVIDHGRAALDDFAAHFPTLRRVIYDPDAADLDRLTDGAHLVIVHEWNAPALVAALGNLRTRHGSFTLLFHDTHHRAATDPAAMRAFDLAGFDGVLAFGETVAEIYRAHGWSRRVWVLHEAADTSTFYPQPAPPQCDLVWIGNWGDEERSAELAEFLIGPASELQLRTDIYGVRYPISVVDDLAHRGIRYRGWLANHYAPKAFGQGRVTVHVPRRPYARALPGIPTIRVFEALACGIPLISAPWEDCGGLFPNGCYLTARDGKEVRCHLRAVLADSALSESLIENGIAAIAARHTCRHRASELLDIHASLNLVPEFA